MLKMAPSTPFLKQSSGWILARHLLEHLLSKMGSCPWKYLQFAWNKWINWIYAPKWQIGRDPVRLGPLFSRTILLLFGDKEMLSSSPNWEGWKQTFIQLFYFWVFCFFLMRDGLIKPNGNLVPPETRQTIRPVVKNGMGLELCYLGFHTLWVPFCNHPLI